MKKAILFFSRFGMNVWVLLLAVVLSFSSASFEGISLGLLVPLINGIIGMDFVFVKEFPLLNHFIQILPDKLIQKNSYLFAFLVLLIFSASIFKNIAQYTASISVLLQVRLCANNLRKRIYERYLSFGKLFFDKSNLGHLNQILVTYTNIIASELYNMQNYLYNIFAIFVYLILMFIISYKLTFIVLFSFPLFHYLLRWLIQKIESSSVMFSESYSDMGKKISNALMSIPLVKAYTNEANERIQFTQLSNLVQKIEFSIDKKRVLIQPLQEIAMLAITLMLVGFIAFLYVRNSNVSIAGYLVFLLVLKRCINLFGTFNNLKGSFAYMKGPLDEIMMIFNDNDKHFIHDGDKELKSLKEKIEFDNVSFSYLKEIEAIRNLSFVIEKGKITAIVGQTGAGKTTIINLLMRFYDVTSGRILIDGCDIRSFTLKSLHSKIALVSQETYLFNSSFKSNLTYGLEIEPSKEVIGNVLKKSRLYDYAYKLPEQLDTLIGDRGVRLSGGEKQRLSIARAILKDPEILILDEATSSLDSETENLIQQALSELIKGKTVIVVAHRLSTIKNADKIIVLESGKLVEYGTLEKLIQSKSRFYDFWLAQRF